MDKRILGLDLGTNSIGWALLEEENGKPAKIIDLGVRLFTKAVEEKTPTPKNVKRRNKRLARRILQRRARRKQRMLNYLVKLGLLPKELQGNTQPEKILNNLGDPYQLRTRALDSELSPHQLGRVLLHLVQRRGFLSNRKTMLGDMVDDPDVQEVLAEMEDKEDSSSEQAKEETAFKKDINELRNKIQEKGCRTLGEYLAGLDRHDVKRNRSREDGALRTDRQMYRDELNLVWEQQRQHHKQLTVAVKKQIEEIIFYQRPLKLRPDRIGKCSLEPQKNRTRLARLEYQRFRYLQDINNLKYRDYYSDKEIELSTKDKKKLIALFEKKPNPTFKTDIRKALGLDKGTEFNLDQDNKKLKGNITACKIRDVLPAWDEWSENKQYDLVEDLLTIKKKSVLKNRLIQHWNFDIKTSVALCMLEFEPGHSNLSVKAINKLLPYLEQGQIYSDARKNAGYGYETEKTVSVESLGIPPEIPNPIVQKGLHELRRVVNAIIAEYGKPDTIRIEMARELEMNTKRYQAFKKQQKANTDANNKAVEKYREMRQKNPHLHLSDYPSRDDKIKYRLWKDQGEQCAYSGKTINSSTLFSAEVEVDHILPYSQSLDDSYMNKVVCYASENRFKGQRTPVDAFGGNTDKWEQITGRISRWHKKLKNKVNRFYKTAEELTERNFINSQLTDTRYISTLALDYLKPLAADISTSKGATTDWIRHQWNLNSLIGETSKKDRTDHRHHAIDAVVIACIDRGFYQTLVKTANSLEKSHSKLSMRDIRFDPPWERLWKKLREDLEQALDKLIVAHVPQRKLSDALHKETGAGYIEKHGGLVYRKILHTVFTDSKGKFVIGKNTIEEKANSIVDNTIKELVLAHLAKYGNDAKKAFAEGITVHHKDGKTPIKRVRVLQSSTTQKKLEQNKFGVKDKSGDIFKQKETGKYKGEFVTMMEAHRRAMTGTKSAKKRKVEREQMIKHNHGDEWPFIMALHKNDLVSIEKQGFRHIYRVQKLDSSNKRINLRLHTAATLKKTSETLPDRELTVPALMQANMLKLQINAIGKQVK